MTGTTSIAAFSAQRAALSVAARVAPVLVVVLALISPIAGAP